MPINSFSGLNMSLRGLLAEQRSLDTTAHNIANINTVGYTRQQAVLGAAIPLEVQAGAIQSGLGGMAAGTGAQLGQGVDVLEYRRVRDQFGDLQYRAQNMSAGQQKTTAQALDQAQDLLTEPGDSGLNKLLSNYWNAWDSAISNPESQAAKTSVLAAGRGVADRLNTIAGSLGDLQTQASDQKALLLSGQGPIQAAAKEISELNDAIKRAVALNEQPNDLLDRRDLLLDQLSGYAQVSVTGQADGGVTVQFGGIGTPPLVDGTKDHTDPTAVNVPTAASITASAGGQLGALADIASPTGTIAGYLADLDGVAAAISGGVNALTTTPFFSGTTAATISVPPGTTVQLGATTASADTSIARQVAALRGSTTDTKYADLVTRMGADAADASRRADTAAQLSGAAEERRQSVNGVSMDEEMTNLVRFQRGYQAASRALSTMDEMLDVLVNRTGRVGL